MPGGAREHGRLALRRPPHRARAGGRSTCKAKRPVYVGRAEAASPATGLGAHASQGTGRSGRPRAHCRLSAGRGRSLVMAVEIKVPALGESVTEATVAKWLVKVGDAVAVDQPLCELETDKVTVEVNATRRRHHRRARRRGRRHRPGRRRALPHRGGRRRRRRRAEAGAAAGARRRSRAAAGAGRLRRARRRAAPRRQSRRLGPAARKLAEEKGVAAAAIQPDRQGRPRHQGRRAGRARVDPGAAARRPPSPPRRPARARAPTARSACA